MMYRGLFRLLFSPLKNNIRIFAQPCNILYESFIISLHNIPVYPYFPNIKHNKTKTENLFRLQRFACGVKAVRVKLHEVYPLGNSRPRADGGKL